MSKEQKILRQKLTISPKTASLLIKAGYHDYRDLRKASPNQVIDCFTTKFGIPQSSAAAYRRALRRIVWLGTTDNPDEQPKDRANWTNKALMARGIWQDKFDDLTGVQVAKLIASAS
jgi:hypothetical protein